jgi:hypothetical protein
MPKNIPEPRKMVRVKDICKYIPLGPTQIAEGIRTGKLPKPVKLLPGGRAAVVFEDQLIAIQQKLAAESAKLNEPYHKQST